MAGFEGLACRASGQLGVRILQDKLASARRALMDQMDLPDAAVMGVAGHYPYMLLGLPEVDKGELSSKLAAWGVASAGGG